uniref:Uncharacterized protein n=1 Tax=Rhizophora mucronata TaxID=61149 RepID=A0A2P2Q9U1_RHIMU
MAGIAQLMASLLQYLEPSPLSISPKSVLPPNYSKIQHL